MLTVPCPGCQKDLTLDQEVCGHCRRPRDEFEIEEGRERVRQEALRRQERPRRMLRFAALFLIIGGAAFAGWTRRAQFVSRVQKAKMDFAAEVERTRNLNGRDPGAVVGPAEGLASSKPAVAASSVVALGSSPASASAAPPAPPAPVPDVVAATPPSPPSSTSERRLYGIVYDLVTKKPIKAAVVRFDNNSGMHWETTTDALGQYQLDIYRHFSPSVLTTRVSATGYRNGHIEDQFTGYYEQSEKSRLRLAADITDDELEPVPFDFAESADVLERNLVLVPEKKRK